MFKRFGMKRDNKITLNLKQLLDNTKDKLKT